MAPKKSVAWDHFVDKGNYTGECKMCKAQISFKSGVSNLMKHVQRKHLNVNIVSGKKNVQQTLSKETQSSSQMPRKPVMKSCTATYIHRDVDKKKEEIDDLLMNLFIYDLQPFSVIEDRGFRALIHYAFPTYIIPSREYLSNNLLTGQYEADKMSTKAAVKENVKTICLTIDMWSSRNNDSYLAVTGHYIDENFKLKSILLECNMLEKNYTELHLADQLLNIVKDWGLDEKISLVVSDNGANIKGAVTQLQWKHFGCYAHSLNFAVEKALGSSAIINVINKVKTIVSYFNVNNLACNILKKYQKKAKKITLQPIQGEMTKWNSTFYMLKRLIEIKEETKCALGNLNQSALDLTTYEWKICETLVVVLQPCEEVTREMCEQKYISGSSVLPITVGLRSAIQEIGNEQYRIKNNIPEFPEEVEACRNDLLKEIAARFSNVENCKTFATSMFLDPRYKLYFQNSVIAEQTKKYVINLVSSLMKDEMETVPDTEREFTPQTSKKCSLIWKHYNTTMQNIRPTRIANSRAILEVQQYMEDRVLSPDINPLDWWRTNQTTYPNLAKIARSILNSMASSVSCERLFSAAGIELTERRNRLDSHKVQQLLFLHQNKT